MGLCSPRFAEHDRMYLVAGQPLEIFLFFSIGVYLILDVKTLLSHFNNLINLRYN